MSVTSLRITSMFGWAWTVSVTARGKTSRATPRAPPAGTGLDSAQRRITDPRRRNSSLSSPEAVSRERFPSEFEHTSSAKCSVRWAGVSLRGRISHNSTKQPSSAACQAASLPASPAPMMVTFGIKEDPPLVALQGGYSTLSQTRAPERAIPSRATVYTPAGRASTAPITGSPFYETKETAYRKPAPPARTPHIPANLSKDVGLSGAVSFSTGWDGIRYSLSIRPYGSGGRAALPQSIQQRISSQPFVHARFAHSFGLHATFLPETSRNRPSAWADYAKTRRLRISLPSRDSSTKRSRFVGGLRALY